MLNLKTGTLCLAYLTLFAIKEAQAFPGESELVTALPGVNFKSTFKHYSGYLEAQNGVFLHYWFFESKSANPAKDPVVLWLNGGPGCSSLMGTLTELGPIRLHQNGTLTANPHAWNAKANLLFLESPAGVGFSYKADGKYNQTDESTALQNFNALRSFFKKFPHLSDNDFYITGESYAGIYIPTLSMQLLEHKFPKNFKGAAIGNGLLDDNLNANSAVHFVYAHGLIDYANWSSIVHQCCPASSDLRHCDFTSKACADASGKLVFPEKMLVNVYNIYGKCLSDPKAANSDGTPENTISHYQALTSLLRSSLNSARDERDGDVLFATPAPDTESPPCLSQAYLARYLNKPEVRKALHISEKSWSWGPCRNNIGYKRGLSSVKSQVKHMVDSGLKVLIYNGDVDLACNFLGDQWFVEELGYSVVHPYAPWIVDGQVAGFTKVYDRQLTFTTVRGAGHMVPEDKPVEALHMFNQFIGV